MLTRKQRELLHDTWRTIEDRFDCLSWSNYAIELLDLTGKETKAHDSYRGARERGISRADEAIYFAIKRLTEYRIGDHTPPKIEHYISVQKSCYYAYAMAIDPRFETTWDLLIHRDGIVDAMREIASWDYYDLIEPKKEESASV